MPDTAILEQLCADAWPAQLERPLGQWRMRAAGGYTGRANSTLTVGDPGMPVARALGEIEDFAADTGIRPSAQVVVGSPVEARLAEARWAVNHAHPRGAESAVLVGRLPDKVPAIDGVEVHATPPEGWWSLAVGSPTPTPAQRHVIETGADVGFGTCHRDGRLVGVVRGCVVTRPHAEPTLHIACLAVAPEHRRRGVAQALLAGLDRWAARRGARRRVLQVAVQNHAALALYAALNYAEHHRYRYWTPAPRERWRPATSGRTSPRA